MNARAIVLLLFIFASPLCAQLRGADTVWVEETLKRMTLEEKVGQLFFPVHTNFERTKSWVQELSVGGIWFARTEARKIAGELNALQMVSKYPLLVTADFEKGAGTYVDGATDLPINMALGASRDAQAVFEAAALTAKEARAIGVHMNFAPVVDVNNNPKNPVINTRSYGEDSELVARMAEAAIRGYQENGLLATGKHFPGHGNTETDTHAKLGIVSSDRDMFESVELFPYKEILRKAKPSSIMSAHLWIKAIDADTVPATLSTNAMGSLLRNRLAFDGIVFTDAMVMGGISTRYPFEVATVKAIQAGCDVILFPGNLEKGIEAILRAVQNGEITEKRIEESVRRILRAKTQVGLHEHRTVDVSRITESVGTELNYGIAKRIASGCLTLASDSRNLIPIKASQRILVVTISNKEGTSIISRGLVSFPDEVKKQSGSVSEFRLSDPLSDSETSQVFAQATDADVVVVAAYIKIILNSGTVELPKSQADFLGRLVDVNPNVVLVSFGNPYIGASVPGVSTYICAFDNAKALQEAAAEALYGKIPFKGKLPVTVSATMKFGYGQ